MYNSNHAQKWGQICCKSVQLVRGSSFRNALLQNPYFRTSILSFKYPNNLFLLFFFRFCFIHQAYVTGWSKLFTQNEDKLVPIVQMNCWKRIHVYLAMLTAPKDARDVKRTKSNTILGSGRIVMVLLGLKLVQVGPQGKNLRSIWVGLVHLAKLISRTKQY